MYHITVNSIEYRRIDQQLTLTINNEIYVNYIRIAVNVFTCWTPMKFTSTYTATGLM